MPRIPAPATKKLKPVKPTPVVATAKPEPKPKPGVSPAPNKCPPPSQLLAEEIARERRLAKAREELSFRRHELLADGLDLSPDEYRVLKTAVPGSPEQNGPEWQERFNRFLRKEDGRVETILSLQTAGGSPADRAASDKLAKTTATARDSQAPSLEEQIRELQNQLADLHQSATSAKSAADARHDADASLRDPKLLPGFINDELAALERRHTLDFGRELIQLEVRRGQLKGLLALDISTKEGLTSAKGHISGNRRFGPDEMARLKSAFEFSTEQRPGGVAYRFTKLRSGVWDDYLNELRAELDGVENRIAEIACGSQSDANRAIEALKSFHVPT